MQQEQTEILISQFSLKEVYLITLKVAARGPGFYCSTWLRAGCDPPRHQGNGGHLLCLLPVTSISLKGAYTHFCDPTFLARLTKRKEEHSQK